MILKNPRIVSLVLVVALMVSMFGVLTVSAAPPTSLDVNAIAKAANTAAKAMEEAILKGQQDVDGVYYGVTYPATISFDGYEMSTEAFILMAANALYALSQGKDAATVISYKDVAAIAVKGVKNGTANTLNKAQYLELAERVAKYGNTMSAFPTSFNRPTDGTNVYDGRMTMYSIGYLFAQILASYNTGKALPANMTFIPVHMGEVEVTPTVPAPSEPDDWFAAIIDAAAQVKVSMDNNILPGTIMVGPVAVTPAQFMDLCCQVVVGIANGQTTGTATVQEGLKEPANPQGTATGKIYTDDFVAMAKKIIAWNDTNPAAPNYSTSSGIGITNYYDVVHMYVKVLNFYKTEKALPNYNTVVRWSGKVEDVTTPTTPTTPPTQPTTSTEPTSASSSSSVGTGEATGWYANVISGAVYLTNYVKEKGFLPATIPVGTYNLKPAQYLYLATQVLVALNSGKTSGELSVPNYNEPQNPQETISGKATLKLSEVVTMAGKVVTFMESNGQGPNWMTSSAGTLQYENGVYTFSLPLAYYAANGTLPATVDVDTWFKTTGGVPGDATFGNDFTGFEKYLVPTANCQSTNATIIAVAKQAMHCPASQSYNYVYENPKSTWEAMWNLTEFTTYVLTYDYYANTLRGALGVWRDKAGNCCDMAHFTNAMARSLGVPGRYSHWHCQFSNSAEGHVWAALYIPDAPDPNINNENGWIYSDPVNNNCKLGYQSFKLLYRNSADGKAELPF